MSLSGVGSQTRSNSKKFQEGRVVLNGQVYCSCTKMLVRVLMQHFQSSDKLVLDFIKLPLSDASIALNKTTHLVHMREEQMHRRSHKCVSQCILFKVETRAVGPWWRRAPLVPDYDYLPPDDEVDKEMHKTLPVTEWSHKAKPTRNCTPPAVAVHAKTWCFAPSQWCQVWKESGSCEPDSWDKVRTASALEIMMF